MPKHLTDKQWAGEAAHAKAIAAGMCKRRRWFDTTTQDEAGSAALLGLIRAADRFDNSRSNWDDWRMRWVAGYVRMYIRSEVQRRMRVTCIDFQAIDNRKLSGEVLPSRGDAAVRRAVSMLSARRQYVIVRRFGLDGQGGATQQQIADELGVSYQAVQDSERRAKAKLAIILAV